MSERWDDLGDEMLVGDFHYQATDAPHDEPFVWTLEDMRIMDRFNAHARSLRLDPYPLCHDCHMSVTQHCLCGWNNESGAPDHSPLGE